MLFMVTVGCEGYTARDLYPFRPSNNSPFRQHLNAYPSTLLVMYETSIAQYCEKINSWGTKISANHLADIFVFILL